MTFHEHSKQIVEEYLGTVSYVDDLVFHEKSYSAVSFGKQDMRILSTGNVKLKEEIAEELSDQKNETPVSRNFNPLALTNAFLKKGIHCALFEVTKDDDSLDYIKKILKKSDVIILDWQMHQDQGRKATELLLSVLVESENPELRLFVIFTNDPNYKELLSLKIIPELKKIGIENPNIGISGCDVRVGHSKIIVIEKENGRKSNNSISDDELPIRIIEEFTDITKGLVSNTALRAISTLRKNTHKLLNVYNNSLDNAYLSHRAMLSSPEDSELLLKDTIVDSLNSLLSYSQINFANDFQQIEKWIEESGGLQGTFKLEIGSKKSKLEIDITNEAKKKWLEVGWKKLIQDQSSNLLEESDYERFEKGKGQLYNKAMEVFIPPNNYSSEEFAILTHHKSNFIAPTYLPTLTLGTVIRRISENNEFYDYFLCIQQRCDCVRISQNEIRNFLFLPLQIDEKRFSIVVKDSKNEYIRLAIRGTNCYDLMIIKFMQSKNGIVESFKDNKSFFFHSIMGSYQWVLDLKESHAQQIANKYAAQLSRVGLNESEWLRRSRG